jgi:hypothetical protein
MWHDFLRINWYRKNATNRHPSAATVESQFFLGRLLVPDDDLQESAGGKTEPAVVSALTKVQRVRTSTYSFWHRNVRGPTTRDQTHLVARLKGRSGATQTNPVMVTTIRIHSVRSRGISSARNSSPGGETSQW